MMKYFIVVLTSLTFFTCHQKANREEIKEAVYSVYLPEFADDSIQVYTTNYRSELILELMKHLGFDTTANLTQVEIIKCEELLQTKILDAYNKALGKNNWPTGVDMFNDFSQLPLREYKRQYMGFRDKKRRKYIIVALWNMEATSDEAVLKFYNDKIFYPIIIYSTNFHVYIQSFIIDLSRKEVKTLKTYE